MTEVESEVIEIRNTLRMSWKAVQQNQDRDDILILIHNHFVDVHNIIVKELDDNEGLDWGEVADMIFLRYDCVDLLQAIDHLFERIKYD